VPQAILDFRFWILDWSRVYLSNMVEILPALQSLMKAKIVWQMFCGQGKIKQKVCEN